MKLYREYYQVVTKDRKHCFSERSTIEQAIEHVTDLLNANAPYNSFEYEILHVKEYKEEEIINYPVAL